MKSFLIFLSSLFLFDCSAAKAQTPPAVQSVMIKNQSFEQPATVYCNPASVSTTVNLPDAIGFTGQNFTIKNIQPSGANTCTVAGINSETIDGSGTVVVANKATLVVQAQLTSPAAGGANWVQLQNN